MRTPDLANSDYLTMFLAGNAPEHVLLPHETVAVEQVLEGHAANFQRIIEEKVSVTGGDDWHDGAFRATDNEANIVTGNIAAVAPYRSAQVVDYPSPHESRVSLGSRVIVSQKSYRFPIDVIGFRQAYPDETIDEVTGESVDAVTPNSPLGKAVIGRQPGDMVTYKSGDRTLEVRIEQINQSILSGLALAGVGVAIDTSETSQTPSEE